MGSETVTAAASGPQVLKEILAGRAMKLAAIGQRAGVHHGTVGRWALDGLKMDDGSVVRLEAVRIGRLLVTSEDAFARFVAATSGGRLAAAAASSPGPSAHRRRKASEAAAAELDAMGVR